MSSSCRTIVALSILITCVGSALSAPDRPELPIGASGPPFSLMATDGEERSLDQMAGAKGTAIIFTCNECPFSRGYEDRLISLARTFQSLGIVFVAINPNDPAIAPGEAFEHMVRRAQDKEFPFPYLVDTTQATAAAYGARVTPHIFLLDGGRKLVYRGRVDDSVKEDEVRKREFRAALEALVEGRTVPVTETRAFGCGVKWARDGA